MSSIANGATARLCSYSCTALMCLLVAASSFAQGRRDVPNLDRVNGRTVVASQVIVKFRQLPPAADHAQLSTQIDADRDEAIGSAGARLIHSRTFDTLTLMAFLAMRPDVEFVEPDYIVEAIGLPNDPSFSSLWGLQDNSSPDADIGAAAAWSVTTGSRSVAVGVIDTGIDYTHPDLAANVWSAPASFSVKIGSTTITCPAGTHGFNAIAKTCDPMDDNRHGTHVSGTIGAVGNNGVGVVGVNWTTSLIAAKFLDASGSGSTSNAINAIEFLIQAKAAFAGAAGTNIRVLSNSWGGGGFSQALLDEINKANTNGMLFVAAAGNNATNTDTTPFYPAGYTAPNVISVAAITSSGGLASFSNYGVSSVDLGAPGSGILSTTLANTYTSMSGTSMATPHVSGAAALVLSVCALDTASLKNKLLGTADVISSLTGITATGGRLNVGSAINSCVAPATIPVTPTGLAATPGDAKVTLTWAGSSGATTYNIKRSLTSGGPYTTIGTATVASFINTGLTNGTTYYYVVTAVNQAGESGNSNQVSANPMPPLPAPPSGVSTRAGDTQVGLSWTAAVGASSYNVKRSLTSGGPYTTVGTATVTSFTNTGLTNGTPYYYVVTAVNLAGESGNSNQAAATPLALPATPTALAATAGNAQVTLSWTASAGASSYNVKRSLTSGGPYTTVGTATVTSFTNTGLTNGTSYYYVVTASNLAGESGNSNQVKATPSSSALPLAPSNLVGSASGSLQVTLQWTGSAGASYYVIKRSSTKNGPYSTVGFAFTGTTYVDTSFATGGTYYYVVTARNSQGESPNSNEANLATY